MRCEDRGRDWNDVSTIQETVRIAGNHQKLGERCGTEFPSEPLEGANPVDILTLDF